MTDSYYNEIPKARVNITLDVETEGAHQKKELPLKLLVLGNFSNNQNKQALVHRKRININKHNFDQILSELSPTLSLSLPNMINHDNVEIPISLTFKKLKDFHPDEIVMRVPTLKKLVAMRLLLRELKSNLIDNTLLRKELEKLSKDKTLLENLREDMHLQAPLMEEV